MGVFPQPLDGRGDGDTIRQFLGRLLPEVSPFQGPGPLALGVGLAGREARDPLDLLPGWGGLGGVEAILEGTQGEAAPGPSCRG